jgi:four helix bundle protein
LLEIGNAVVFLDVSGGTTHAALRPVAGFRELEVWQYGMRLVERCYAATSRFPSRETYGLSSQIRRAAVSIPSNVAEGYCRRSTRAYANHVTIALGSHGELETCLELSGRLGFIDTVTLQDLENCCRSVGKMLTRLHQTLVRNLNSVT